MAKGSESGEEINKKDQRSAKHFLDKKVPHHNPETGRTERTSRLEIIYAALFKKAKAGNVAAAKELLDRGLGKPLQAAPDKPQVGTVINNFTWGELKPGEKAETKALLEAYEREIEDALIDNDEEE